MKRLALAFALLSYAALAAAQSDTSAIVDASKDAKAKRKKSTSKVITNKDVKKSKGKLIELQVDKPIDEGPSITEMQDAEHKTRRENAERIAKLDQEIAVLEKELAKIEQSYFEENDPNVRDGAIVKKFNDTKAKLDALKAEREKVSS